jgi:hypothetical protein
MQGTVRGPVAGREHLLLIWMRLPLSGLSGTIERVLGYDAAIPIAFHSSYANAGFEDRVLLPARDKRRAHG